MAASSVFAGLQMANTFLPVAKTTSYPSGQSKTPRSWHVAKGINPGSRLFASIPGAVMTGTTASVALVKTADSYFGISV